MNLREIRNYCQELASKYGYILDIPIEINTRLKRTLGRVVYKNENNACIPVKIEFSRDFIIRATNDEILETIKHEMAHYFVLIDTRKSHNHDEIWKAWAYRLGCRQSATMKTSNHKQVPYKYLVYCSECGKLIGKYKVKSNVIKNSRRYRSRCCNSEIRVILNIHLI